MAAKKSAKKVEDIEAPKQEVPVEEEKKVEQDPVFAQIMSMING